MRDHNALRVHEAATQLQQYLRHIFADRVSGVIIPPIERVQAYTLRELTLRVEQGANIPEAKRRLYEAINHIGLMPLNKNVKIIADVDPQ